MTPAKRPIVWLLLGHRVGDNAQVRWLGAQLDAEIIEKTLAFTPLHVLPNRLAGSGLHHLTAASRNGIVAPWPDLVIATGKRAAPVARYIARVSGGRTRLVHIGRPRMRLDDFDLIITTPQYGLPQRTNVIEMALPFAVPGALAGDVLAHWRKAWQHLPEPWIGVAVGAAKFPQRFGIAEARLLAQHLEHLARTSGGSLIIMASPRTSADVMAELAKPRGVPTSAHPWQPGQNPYQAALNLCHRFVVTSDSMSMLSEVIGTGRPADIFRLPVSPLFMPWRADSGLPAALASSGWLSPPRNMPRVIDRILADGLAGELGGPSGSHQRRRRDATPSGTGREEAVARVKALL